MSKIINCPARGELAVLLFKKKFLPAIRSGRKTQTVRLWKFRRMRSGQRSYIPGAGYIQVHSVEAVDLAELTEEDAERDGFDTLAELLAELQQLYAQELAEGWQTYRIRFELTGQQPDTGDVTA